MNKVKEWFSGITTREQIIVIGLSMALVVGCTLVGAYSVLKKKSKLESEEAELRSALVVMALHRQEGPPLADTSQVEIPEEAPQLTTLLDDAAKKASSGFAEEEKIQIPRKKTLDGSKEGDIQETLMQTDLSSIKLAKVMRFLEEIEKQSDVVKIKELEMRRDLRDKEKSNVRLVVSGFSKVVEKEEE